MTEGYKSRARDPAGNLAWHFGFDLTGTTGYGYDAADRIANKATPFGNVNWTYDIDGNVLSIGGGSAINQFYTYDELNRLKTATSDSIDVTTYSYDPVGNLAGTQTGALTATSYSYDPQNRLTQMQTVCGASASGCGLAGTVLRSYAYTLGPAGNRTSVAEVNGRTVSYEYDDLYRLTTETVAGDPAGKNGKDAIGDVMSAIFLKQLLSAGSQPISPSHGYLSR